MLIRHIWTEQYGSRQYFVVDGWYLFGVIPLYVDRQRIQPIELKRRP